MLMPAERILDVIAKEFQKVCDMLPEGQNDASSAQAIGCALQLLRERESQGNKAIERQFNGITPALKLLRSSCSASYDFLTLDNLLQQATASNKLTELEALWLQTLAALENILNQLKDDPAVSAEQKNTLRSMLVSFEADDLLEQLGTASQSDAEDDASNVVTRDKMTAYLQDRFDEPDLKVSSLQPLTGGFGKETVVFSVEGKALNGEFVMRRDIGDNAGLANDCHLIGMEYPVIKAANDRGFPAPDALWLDTEHRLLPGSDFIIMRRSPGTNSGNFFGAKTEIPATLAKKLADIMAGLHSLPPLLELGDLNESICSQYWQQSKSDCIEQYIRGWYEFWRAEAHSPSPALVSLYTWLLDNIPQREGAPSLIHGDIGFHNFLMENGEISAVLDWEFAHVGDPAEELGYVKVTVGEALNWDEFMAAYIAAGGSDVDAKTLHYFQVWAYVRNASGANIISNRFVNARADDLKLSVLPYYHIPHFIRGAQALIDNTPE